MPKPIRERLTSPCAQRWTELVPRGEGRYCAACDTTVIDLSRLTKRAALERTREGACVRVRLDARGEPLFRPEPERRLGRRALAVVAAFAGGCSASAPSEPDEVRERELELPPTQAAPPELPEGVAIEELDAAELSFLDERITEGENAIPTPEQIALTRRKQARHAALTTAVPSYEFMGGMVADDF